jgi:hypothetical protein
MLKKISGLMLLLFILFLTGCPAVQEEPTDPSVDKPTDKKVQTIKWVIDESDNYCQFYTNDRNYCGTSGTSVYHITNSETTMDTVITDVMKMSGKSDYGYGVLFCGKDNGDTLPDDTRYDFYSVTIYTDGYFRIAKRVSGIWKIIQLKKSNSSLYAVSGGVNTIKVKNNGLGSFTLVFNGHEEAPIPFTDNTAPIFTGGYYGYITDIGDDENFPNTPVDVKFKQTTPAL